MSGEVATPAPQPRESRGPDMLVAIGDIPYPRLGDAFLERFDKRIGGATFETLQEFDLAAYEEHVPRRGLGRRLI